MKKLIIPKADPERVLWLNQFAAALNNYAAKYNILPAEVTVVKSMAVFFDYWIAALTSIRDFSAKVTAFKNNMANGVEPNAENPTEPGFPVLAPPPPMVISGIFPFVMTIVKRIKSHKDYVTDDGEEMGIEADDITMPDVQTLKPVIKHQLVNGGYPQLQWVKQQTDGVLIQVNRTGNWEFLAIDTVPDYIDTHPLPASGSSAVWQYRMIYRLDDANVGQWSDVVSITVTGV